MRWGNPDRQDLQSAFFHFPAKIEQEMPSYAFPFSRAEVERGEVFAFHINHVVETTSPFELVRTRWIDLASEEKATRHA